jgi:hypothetical protein
MMRTSWGPGTVTLAASGRQGRPKHGSGCDNQQIKYILFFITFLNIKKNNGVLIFNFFIIFLIFNFFIFLSN